LKKDKEGILLLKCDKSLSGSLLGPGLTPATEKNIDAIKKTAADLKKSITARRTLSVTQNIGLPIHPTGHAIHTTVNEEGDLERKKIPYKNPKPLEESKGKVAKEKVSAFIDKVAGGTDDPPVVGGGALVVEFIDSNRQMQVRLFWRAAPPSRYRDIEAALNALVAESADKGKPTTDPAK